MKFKVGDKVIGIGNVDGIDIAGMCGTVVDINTSSRVPIGVNFEGYNYTFHSCDGKCEDRHGWYCEESSLELVFWDDRTRSYQTIIGSDGDGVKFIEHPTEYVNQIEQDLAKLK